MADDDVTVVLDSEGTIGTTGSMPLLALELTTIEKAGLISEIDEDSNLQALGNPLLGTSTPQVLEISRGSSKKRSPESICYDNLLREDGPSSGVKSREIASLEGHVCYGIRAFQSCPALAS